MTNSRRTIGTPHSPVMADVSPPKALVFGILGGIGRAAYEAIDANIKYELTFTVGSNPAAH